MKKSRAAGMDMLHGSMFDKMLLFALPLAAGSILQQLFNAVDVAVVGRFSSSQALAAVGANSSVISLLVNLFVGISVGANVVIAHLIGKGEKDRVKSAVHTALLLALISGVLMMFVGLVIARPLLALMSTPEDVLDMAVLYLRIYCLSMPFSMFYDFGASILRSVGDTKRPLICLETAGRLNAVLNLFFVIVCGLSVSGVAIATVISNVVSAGLLLYFLYHTEEIVRADLKALRLNKTELIQILKIGIPAGIQGMVFSVANVCIQSSVNSFGSDAVAGSSVAVNFEMFSYYVVNGFNAAVMTFMSQNLGAGNRKRCRKAYGIGMASAVVSVLILNSIMFLARNPLIGLFTGDPAVADFAVQRMSVVLLTHFMICSYEITGSALRGVGKSLVPAVLTVFGTCVLRIVYVNTVVIRHHDFRILMAVYPFSWIVTGAMVVIAFFVVMKKMHILWNKHAN